MPQTIVTFSAADEGQKFSLKMLCCEARAFPVGMAYDYMISRPFFTPRKKRMHMNLDHVANGVLFVGETFIASLIIGHWQ